MNIFNTTQNLPSKIKIGNRYVGEGEPVYFIAEIGNNHNGDYYLAKKHIEAAAQSGADAVKFQKRYVTDVFAKELLEREQTKDQVFGKTYREYREHLELGIEDYQKLKTFAESFGLVFFATPFDLKSVDFLDNLGMEVYKISSFDVTNLPLLEYTAQRNKPIILSVGMSTWEEVDDAVKIITKYNPQLIIKHCVAAYPTPDEHLNLSVIPHLRERYAPLPIGYSGHEQDILPSLAAIALGAKCIERHFTLDKQLPGPDHATVSLEPSEFRAMVDGARRLEKGWGDPLNRIIGEERRVRDKHSKSLVSTVDIPAGSIITSEMLTVKSPGYGLKPKMTSEVIGSTAKVDIPKDTVLIHDFIAW